MHANMQAEIQLKNKNLKKILDLEVHFMDYTLQKKGGNVHDDRKNDNIK